MFKGMRGRVYRALSAKMLDLSSVSYAWCSFMFTSQKRAQKSERIRNADPKVIAVIQTLALGDTILTEPSVEVIKKHFPKAKLIVIATEYTKELFLNNPFVDQIVVYKKNMNAKEYLTFVKELRKEKMDLVFDFQNTFTDWKRTMLPFLSGARERVGFTREAYHGFLNTVEIPAPQRKHEIEHYKGLVSCLEEKSKEEEKKNNSEENLPLPNMFITEEENEWTRNFLKEKGVQKNDRVIGLHPCNLNHLKQWKPEYFAEVAAYCQKKYGAEIIITGTEQEKHILEKIKKHLQKECIFLTELSVREFCRLIARYNLLISVDTSAIHIAAATRTPTIALFGPTDPVCWKPANTENQVMVQTKIACQPCERTSHKSITLNRIMCPFAENYCLTELHPNEVFKIIDSFMKKK